MSQEADVEINRGDMAGETVTLAVGVFLSWFNLLKYLEWDIKVCLYSRCLLLWLCEIHSHTRIRHGMLISTLVLLMFISGS